jgi:uncharacterized sulfatase
MIRALLLCLSLLAAGAPSAQNYDYQLAPTKIADNVYSFVGKAEDFSVANGGNIVNTSFVVTPAGVVIIDAGPSLRYGEQMRAAIAKLTTTPATHILVTHAHPDHYIGAQAFPNVGVYAVPQTTTDIKQNGGPYLDNMFRLLLDWMKGSRPNVPDSAVTASTLTVGGRSFRLLSLTGHTRGDLAVLDETSGTLFTGDLVFFGRTPTTPHASVPEWLASLDVLEKLPFTTLVPGHGAPHRGKAGIEQTRGYLTWLDSYLKSAAARGADMSELLAVDVPARWSSLAVFREEFQRTLAHLYPAYEREVLQ